jgi:hypothetical protein
MCFGVGEAASPSTEYYHRQYMGDRFHSSLSSNTRPMMPLQKWVEMKSRVFKWKILVL